MTRYELSFVSFGTVALARCSVIVFERETVLNGFRFISRSLFTALKRRC
jgi:hypothetical protein